MDLIPRPVYLNQLKELRETDLIKVVTGVRRCGKSKLFELYQRELRTTGVTPKQIISINFEDRAYHHLLNPEALYSHVAKLLDEEAMNFVFLDEVQQVAEFQSVVDSLYIKKNVDLYITGSNAHILSSELSTLLSGRYIEIKMMPLSFKEYISAVGKEGGLRRAYNDYVQHGSLPYTIELRKNKHALKQYMDMVFNTIFMKDVSLRNDFRDLRMLESVIMFLFDSVGSLVSSKKIADTLSSSGRSTSSMTIDKYLFALNQSYLFYKADRFDVKGREHLRTLEKYYCIDLGMRYHLSGSRSEDTGHVLENVVYLELLRRYQSVYVGRVGTQEIDFVTKNDEGYYTYFQVAATITHPETREREFAPLLSIDDHYPKYLLTLDEIIPSDYQGIKILNVLDYLLS